MPITEELKNVKKFETVGFSHEQAESLEEAQVSGHESLKDFIRSELVTLRFTTKDICYSNWHRWSLICHDKVVYIIIRCYSS